MNIIDGRLAIPVALEEGNNLRDRVLRDFARIRLQRRGERFRYGGAELEELAPSLDYVAKGEPHNNDSMAFRVTFGRHSFS